MTAGAGGAGGDAGANFLVLSLCFVLVIAAACAAAVPALGRTADSPLPPPPPRPLCEWSECNCTGAGSRVVASCTFGRSQEVEVAAGALPAWLLELHVIGGGAVRVTSGAFAALRDPRLFNVTGSARLLLRRHAFLNASSQHLFVSVADCSVAVFETGAFRATAGPVSLDVRRCGHVVVQGGAFAWLLRVAFAGVARLELASHAFALDQPDARRHGPAPSVLLQSVMISELPPSTFPSRVAEVRLVDTQVRAVRGDAFSALQLSAVAFENSSLQRVEAGAFSPRTLVIALTLRGARVGVLAHGAMTGAVTSLTMMHSRISEVEPGALNITVASVEVEGCEFGTVGAQGLVFREWSALVMKGNVFGALHPRALEAPFTAAAGLDVYRFSFRDNVVTDLRESALAAAAAAAEAARKEAALLVEVSGTWLDAPCRCDLPSRLGGDAGLLASTTCAVDAALARCLGVPEGRVSAAEYASRVCADTEQVLICESGPAGPLPHAPADGPDATKRGRTVLVLIFTAVVLGSLAALAASGTLWLRRKGYCRGAPHRWAPPASAASCLAQIARLWAAGRAAPPPRAAAPGAATATAPAAANHAPAAMYTELRRRDEDEEDDEEEGGGAGAGAGAEAEDKWTQTLPEELTQELLAALREKLDDPENYSEARDMIEHLYDLIKVEESCSNNNRPGGVGGSGSGEAGRGGSMADLADLADDDNNLYEAIRPRVRRARDACSVGTRAPSPDALEPPATPRPAARPAPAPASAPASAPPGPAALLCEYVEPRDRAQHLYAEVPGGAAPSATTSPGQRRVSRPLSFLRALGESLQSVLPRTSAPAAPPPPPPGTPAPPPRPAQAAASLLCEYAEPTDAAVHVYSELPTALANRPLPDTPPSTAAAP